MMSIKSIEDLSLQELDDLFRSATELAREEAKKHNLPVYGIDAKGELQTENSPETSQTAIAPH